MDDNNLHKMKRQPREERGEKYFFRCAEQGEFQTFFTVASGLKMMYPSSSEAQQSVGQPLPHLPLAPTSASKHALRWPLTLNQKETLGAYFVSVNIFDYN